MGNYVELSRVLLILYVSGLADETKKSRSINALSLTRSSPVTQESIRSSENSVSLSSFYVFAIPDVDPCFISAKLGRRLC